MTEHYYSKEQTSTIKLKKISVLLRKKPFLFYLSSGVFSKDRIDIGTELLVESMILKKDWKCLDLGCGAGVVGIVASRFVDRIYLSDINIRACEITKMNIKLNKCENATVLCSDLFYEMPKMMFDTILVNPPQTAGKKLCFKMIEESKLHLKKGGLLQLVARHNKGGSTLSDKMKEVFSNVKAIAKKGGFRVYVSYNT